MMLINNDLNKENMNNQHQKIKGYRELTQEEIDVMNEIKEKGEELRALVIKIEACINDVPAAKEGAAFECDHPLYWLRCAESNYRTATMFAVRAIAQPTSY
jgi:hypothetical protein